MKETAIQLLVLTKSAKPRLLSISEAKAGEKPLAEKWSLKEILGHLIDSATNNHHRIVRMQASADIGTFTYEQEHWVNSQHYQEEQWENVVELWYRYNVHVAHVIAHVDEASLNNRCDMGYEIPAPLRFVIEDYVRHVQHHLDQIFSGAKPLERKRWMAKRPS